MLAPRISVNGNTVYYRKQESERYLAVIRLSRYVTLTKCLTILPVVSPTFLPATNLCLAGTALIPSLTNCSSSSFRATCASPCPGIPCALLGCSGESPGTSSVPVVQNHIVGVWLHSYVLSLSVGRMHPVRGAGCSTFIVLATTHPNHLKSSLADRYPALLSRPVTTFLF